MFPSKPDFVVIGAQKGGTTSLFRYLSQHRFVTRSFRKELRYFSERYARGEQWYKAQFPTRLALLGQSLLRRGRVQTGEATPYYLYHPWAPQRLRDYCPDARLVAMLRNPVDRAYSHYRHHLKLGEESLGFEQALAAESERIDAEKQRVLADAGYVSEALRMYSYKDRGVYADQLERWFEVFDPAQILVLSSEEFFADPERIFVQTQEFLGLPLRKRQSFEAFNPGRKDPIEPATRAELQSYFEPHNRRLFELLDRDLGWND